jgi:hypothetical protein
LSNIFVQSTLNPCQDAIDTGSRAVERQRQLGKNKNRAGLSKAFSDKQILLDKRIIHCLGILFLEHLNGDSQHGRISRSKNRSMDNPSRCIVEQIDSAPDVWNSLVTAEAERVLRSPFKIHCHTRGLIGPTDEATRCLTRL